jgi:hypothetical protein
VSRGRSPITGSASASRETIETRPIGIPTFEDKVLQRAVAMVLDAVYEQDFRDCSFGFRPGRSAHQALEALWKRLMAVGGGWAGVGRRGFLRIPRSPAPAGDLATAGAGRSAAGAPSTGLPASPPPVAPQQIVGRHRRRQAKGHRHIRSWRKTTGFRLQRAPKRVWHWCRRQSAGSWMSHVRRSVLGLLRLSEETTRRTRNGRYILSQGRKTMIQRSVERTRPIL